MISITNVLKAVLICAICSAVYNYYFATYMFVQQLSTPDHVLGRFESFMLASEVTDGFWPKVFKGWAQTFVLALFACFALLLWLIPSTPNKALVRDAGEKPPAPHS